MSCQQNSAAAAGAGVKNGVAGTASKVAYAIGAATTTGVGASVGGLIGGGIGAILGPAGAAAGTATGMAVGGRAGYKTAQGARAAIQETRQRAATEKAWKDSKAGQRAIKSRNTQWQRAREKYTNTTTKLKAQKDTATKRYQAAKEEWMNENTGLNAALKGGTRGAAMTPEARAAAAGVAAGVVNVIGQTITRQARGGGGQQDLGKKVGVAAYQQMKQYKTRVEEAKLNAWLSSPEGKVANAHYEKTMNTFKAQEEQHAAQYNQVRASANRRYNTTRTKFSEQYKRCRQAAKSPRKN